MLFTKPRYANHMPKSVSPSGHERVETVSIDMNPSVANPAELKPAPDVANPVDALLAEMDSAAILQAIQAREATVMSVMEKTLQIRPTSHWGLNE
jgi:hypothetical protein